MSEYAVNTWLNPVIQAYERFFGKVEKPVVWEVGSRDGKDGEELARRIYKGKPMWFWSNARVVALEPNPDQVKIIKENYPEIDVLEVAASNAKGSAPFKVYEGDEGTVGSSSLNLNWKPGVKSHQIIVKTDTLEHLIGDDQIDIMAIDVEGHSLEVLGGLGDKLSQVKVYYIETEKWDNTYVQVKAFMMSKGYTLVSEDEHYGGMPELVLVRS